MSLVNNEKYVKAKLKDIVVNVRVAEDAWKRLELNDGYDIFN